MFVVRRGWRRNGRESRRFGWGKRHVILQPFSTLPNSAQEPLASYPIRCKPATSHLFHIAPFHQQHLLHRLLYIIQSRKRAHSPTANSIHQTNRPRCIALIPCASRARLLPHKFKTPRHHNRLPRPAVCSDAATLVCLARIIRKVCHGLIFVGHNFRKSAAGAFGPDLAKKLNQLVKMEKNCMRTMELVGRERMESAVSCLISVLQSRDS